MCPPPNFFCSAEDGVPVSLTSACYTAVNGSDAASRLRFKILIGNFPLFPREGIPAQQRHELRHELRSSKLRCGIDQMVLLLAHIGALKDKARQLFVPLQFVQEI